MFLEPPPVLSCAPGRTGQARETVDENVLRLTRSARSESAEAHGAVAIKIDALTVAVDPHVRECVAVRDCVSVREVEQLTLCSAAKSRSPLCFRTN